MKDTQRLVLLDAHAIIHRAFHALPDFTSSSGEPTGALYGFISMLIKIAKDLDPDYVVACYDLPGKTFRHEAYDDYKAGRSTADDALIEQLGTSRDVCVALGIPIYDEPGFEADDIIGTIVEKVASKKNLEVIIASGDMDTLQLIDGKRVTVYTLKKGLNDTILYDHDAVVERYGFTPNRLIDYKGLRGDPSDNIPGVRGIGEKIATELIMKFGSIEDMYALLEGEGGQDIFLDKGIKKRPISLLEEGKEEALFSKTLATIRRDAPIVFELPDSSWKEGVDPEAVKELCDRFELRTLWRRLVELFDIDEVSKEERSEDEKLTEREITETAIGVWLLNSELTNPGRDEILSYTGAPTISKAREMILAELTEKNLMDVYVQIELPIIDAVAAMSKRGVKLDTACLKNLSKTYHAELDRIEAEIYEDAGEEFNIKSPKQLSEVLFEKMQLPTSTDKGRIKKNASGGYSTRESELAKLAGEHPIVGHILEYRELQKLLSTYIDNLPGMVQEDGRLHADFLQAGTSTGRFSSQNPNLQNIPIRSEYGRAIREAFVASEGYVLVGIDYSQIELRCAAILSGDEYLTEIFKQGQDVHTAVAARVFDVDPSDVTPNMRRSAKAINFGIIYGMGVTALQKSIGTTRKEAQAFYDQYFENFKGVAEYLESTKAFAHKHGYTETLFGRRRYYPGLQSHIPYIRAQAERFATNAPIQGTATADIIKLAIKHADALIREKGWHDDVHLVLQIHDELMYEVAEPLASEVVPAITDAMEHVLQNSWRHIETEVPLSVHAGQGKRWSDIKD